MSELYTKLVDTPGKQFSLDIVHAQDVEPITEECAKHRLRSQQGKQGLGVLVCSIPVVEMEKAKHQGIDLSDKKQREKWLSRNPKYRCYEEKGRSGKIIIK